MPESKSDADWRVEFLRLTVFPDGTSVPSDSLWERLTHETPEVEENRPKEGVRREAGPYGNGYLDVKVAPGRIDVVMHRAASDMDSLFFYGHFKTEAGEFKELVAPWLNDIGGNINRIAFAGNLLHETDGREQSYELLGKFVPSVTVDPVNTKELTYRINRPVSGEHGVNYNRITSWSTIRAELQVGSPPDSMTPHVEKYFLKLDFDHNTVPGRQEPLDNAMLSAIFADLVDLALENAAKGECP